MAVERFRSSQERGIQHSISADERRALRIKSAINRMPNWNGMTSIERLQATLVEVVEHEEIWAPFDDSGLFSFFDDKNRVNLVPIWPREQLLRTFCVQMNWRVDAVPIPVVDWIDDVSVSMHELDVRLAIAPISLGSFEIRSTDDFICEIEYIWRGYAKSLM